MSKGWPIPYQSKSFPPRPCTPNSGYSWGKTDGSEVQNECAVCRRCMVSAERNSPEQDHRIPEPRARAAGHWLTLTRSNDRLSRFFVCGFAPFCFTFIPQLLAFSQRYLNLYFTFLKVHPSGDQRQPALLCLANQFANLLFMHQQLPGSQGGVIKDVAVLVGADVAVQQPELAVFD